MRPRVPSRSGWDTRPSRTAYTGAKVKVANVGAIFADRVVLGVMAGRVLGKFLGVSGGAWLPAGPGLARLSAGAALRWMKFDTAARPR
ncbi:Na+/H+ antiporter NhaA [Nonomuraea sp. NPDC050404]|uniref:Na+/H+ antiporter NhaA n=1 Tax=Nonomuraea sp. NPDC050404 TaxID=3155783 RepID=UPI0033F0FA9F